MKKRLLALIIVLTLILSACGSSEKASSNTAMNQEEAEDEPVEIKEPDMSQIIAICKLATLECVYHNVAKSVKEKGTGLSSFGKKDRKYWIEYSGVVKLGVDMSKGSINVSNGQIIVEMPDAEILSIKEYPESEQDPIMSEDNKFFQKNPIQSDEMSQSIKDAQANVREQIENNSSLLVDAKERAKKLIENYIKQVEDAIGATYIIKWVDIED